MFLQAFVELLTSLLVFRREDSQGDVPVLGVIACIDHEANRQEAIRLPHTVLCHRKIDSNSSYNEQNCHTKYSVVLSKWHLSIILSFPMSQEKCCHGYMFVVIAVEWLLWCKEYYHWLIMVLLTIALSEWLLLKVFFNVLLLFVGTHETLSISETNYSCLLMEVCILILTHTFIQDWNCHRVSTSRKAHSNVTAWHCRIKFFSLLDNCVLQRGGRGRGIKRGKKGDVLYVG